MRGAATLGRVKADISVVLFDCDGVLQRPGNDWTGEIGSLTGLSGGALDAFLDDISSAEQPVLDGSEAYGVRLAEVLEEWSLPVRVEDLLQVWQHLVVDQGVLAAAEELREQGLVCALGTNQHRERAAYMRRELGYHRLFDPIVISAEIGVAKPDPEFFRRALVLLGRPAAEVLFVDDVQANVDAARSVGLAAERFAQHGGRTELDRILALHGLAERVAA
jgi:HAD superfamily hydrolase (TIGR01509 family)